MKPIDIKSNTLNTILTVVRKLIMKILNLKLGILLEYQKIKAFFQKAMLEIGLKKVLWFKKLKILCRGHMLLVTLTENLLERFMRNNCEKKKKNQKEFIVGKLIKRKGAKLYVKWKGYDMIYLIIQQRQI